MSCGAIVRRAAASDMHPSVVLQDDLVAHPESKPGPRGLLGGKEGLKDAPAHIRLHPDSRIRNRKSNPTF